MLEQINSVKLSQFGLRMFIKSETVSQWLIVQALNTSN